MSNLQLDMLTLGQVQTNCYILSDKETKKAIIFDPADEPDKILDYLRRRDMKLEAVLLTHGHFDHILAASQVAEGCHTKIYAGYDEKDLLEDMGLNLSKMFGSPVTVSADEFLKDGQILNLLGHDIQVIATPGHTKGSVCYYIPAEKMLISGDTLFFESLGRTDFPTGDSERIIASLKDKLFILPDDVMVYPGHGCHTSIAYEKENNPYV